ncbi:MAG: hypothetical protein V4443_10875 [Pseudomonadota bacterium]
MNTSERPSWLEKNRVLVAVYASEQQVQSVVKSLIDQNYQMDLISILGRIHAIGDDPLGIYNLNAGDRMMAWGKQGGLWGGLWGILVGAAGLFMIPGIGIIAAAGFLVEAIAGGAIVGAGAMAGAAALSQLAVAFHRAGIPEEEILNLHKAIEEGKYVLMLRGAESELDRWREVLASGDPLEVHDLPYMRVIDQSYIAG